MSKYNVDQNGKNNSYRVWWLNEQGYTVERDGFATREAAQTWAEEREFQAEAMAAE